MNDRPARRGLVALAALGRVPVGGTYPAASIIALALVCGVDAALSRGPYDALFVLALTGLVAGLGMLHGLAWQALQSLVRRLPRLAALAFWPLACPALGLLLADRIGAWNRLGGRYGWMAIGVIAGCSAGGLLFGALLAAFQPTARWPLGRVQARPRRRRLAGTGLLLALAIGTAAGDRKLYPDLYPDGHLAMRLFSLWLFMLALVLCDGELRLPRLTGASLLGVAALTAVPLFVLDAGDTRALQAFGVRAWPTLVLSWARTLTDIDGDGHSALLGGGDCAPFDPRVNPAAREIPDNGVDDNCIMGDARRSAAEDEKMVRPAKPSPMDVVLITIDSLRPDRLGIYNEAYRKPKHRTTPLLDEWAANATVFRNAYTSGGWTSVALPSLMRGLFPRRMRWTYFYETTYYEMIRKPLEPKLRPGERAERIYPLAFDDPRPSLAQRLQHRGMHTVGVVDDGYSQIFQRSGGASLGFDTYIEIDREPRARRGNQGVVDLAIGQLQRTRKHQRLFMWVHLFGVHGPDDYYPGAPTFGDSQSGRYDHEVAGLDPDLHRLLVAIDERLDKPAVFITSDHGEELDRGPRNHGFSLDDVIIRIPLIARVPGWPARFVDDPVSIVDIMPTILALTQTPGPRTLDGRDLAPLAHGVPQPPRILFSDTWQLDAKANRMLEMVAAYDAGNKVVYDRKKHLMLVHERDRYKDGRLGGNSIDALSRAILGYLDETGGELHARD